MQRTTATYPQVNPHPRLVWIILFVLVGVICMGTCGCTPKRPPNTDLNVAEAHEFFRLRAYPEMTVTHYGSIKFTGTISDGWAVECPGVMWDWGYDIKPSTQDGSCTGDFPVGFHKTHFFGAPGNYTITLSLWKKGKVVRRASTTVQIGAP